MHKKILISCLVIMAMLLIALPVSADSNELDVFEFENVYQYDIDTYEKTISYKNMKVVIKDAENLDLFLDGKNYENLKYEKQFSNEFNTTLISASGEIDDQNSVYVRLVYDKKENANGNIVLTRRHEALPNEFNKDLSSNVLETKEYIRFAAIEPIDLKTLANGVEKNTVQGIPDPISKMSLMASGFACGQII